MGDFLLLLNLVFGIVMGLAAMGLYIHGEPRPAAAYTVIALMLLFSTWWNFSQV